jgi:hypothetical protein
MPAMSLTDREHTMTVPNWNELSPEQQAEVWRQHNTAQQPAPAPAAVPARQSANAFTYVAMVCAVLSWLLLPIPLGVVAVVAALVGDILTHKATGKNSKLAIAALLIALAGMLAASVLGH